MMFPVMISSLGVFTGLLTIFLILHLPYYRVTNISKIEPTLK